MKQASGGKAQWVEGAARIEALNRNLPQASRKSPGATRTDYTHFG